MRRLIPLVAIGLLWLSPSALAGGWNIRSEGLVLGGRTVGLVTLNGQELFRIQDDVGTLSAADRAAIVARRLTNLVAEGRLKGNQVVPAHQGGQAVVAAGGDLIITVDDWGAALQADTTAELATAWADNLRAALGAPPYRPPARTVSRGGDYARPAIYGVASWYGSNFAGRETANGETFNPDLFTAASPWLPFNTLLRVTYLATGQSVLVRVNDRGPYVSGRILDLSREAAKTIGLSEPGIGEVRIQVL